MIIIKSKKIRIKTYTRNNHNNEFETYLKTCKDKEAEKLIETIANIEKFGIIQAKKNQWMKKIRDTGINEIRSNVGNNQQRAYCIYDHQLKTYIILTAKTKKIQRINKPLLDQINVIQTEYQNQSIASRKNKLNNWQKFLIKRKESQTMQKPNTIKNKSFKANLASLTNYTNLNQLNQNLRLKPNSINRLVDSPGIQYIKPLCNILKIDANDLLQYDPRHQSYPEKPILKTCQQWTKNKNQNISKLDQEINYPITKIDNRIPIKTLFAVADYYQIDMNQIFETKSIENVKVTATNKKPEIKKETKIDQTTFNIFNNIKELLDLDHITISKYAHQHDLKPNDIFNVKYSRIIKSTIEIAKRLNTNVETLLNYKLPESENILATVTNQKTAPLMNYINQHFQNNSNQIKQFIESIDINEKYLNRSAKSKTLYSLVIISKEHHLTVDQIINHDFNTQITNHVNKPTIKIDEPIQKTETKIKTEFNPITKPIIPNESNSRLNRLFENIQKLNANQILILNDIVNSWSEIK